MSNFFARRLERRVQELRPLRDARAAGECGASPSVALLQAEARRLAFEVDEVLGRCGVAGAPAGSVSDELRLLAAGALPADPEDPLGLASIADVEHWGELQRAARDVFAVVRRGA